MTGALERGMRPIVCSRRGEVGHVVRQCGHVRMFSPWSHNVDRVAEQLLAGHVAGGSR
jgi:hypothetical protein